MQLALAPMEGLVDDAMRTLLTEIGGIDWCVSEFVRINSTLLPAASFLKLAPEIAVGSCTPSGTPMRLQLLGSDPSCLADNAAFAVTLGAPVIDLNFGCPAKTVNKSKGGAVLLKEPELMHAIVSAVRAAVPAAVPVTAKMRLGFDHADDAEEEQDRPELGQHPLLRSQRLRDHQRLTRLNQLARAKLAQTGTAIEGCQQACFTQCRTRFVHGGLCHCRLSLQTLQLVGCN